MTNLVGQVGPRLSSLFKNFSRLSSSLFIYIYSIFLLFSYQITRSITFPEFFRVQEHQVFSRKINCFISLIFLGKMRLQHSSELGRFHKQLWISSFFHFLTYTLHFSFVKTAGKTSTFLSFRSDFLSTWKECKRWWHLRTDQLQSWNFEITNSSSSSFSVHCLFFRRGENAESELWSVRL